MSRRDGATVDDLPSTATVVIAGGGPSGLMSALDLDRRGIDSVVIEPRIELDYFRPRAKTTNARTMTLLRGLGVADRLRAAAPLDPGYSEDVVFCTALDGYELRRFHNAFQLYEGGFAHAPEIGQQVPQPIVEQVLREAVSERGRASLLTGLRVVDVRPGQRPVVTVADQSGNERTIEAGFVIGADGGNSAVRRSLGIEFEGSSAARPNFNVVFRSERLRERVTIPNAVQYWVVGEVSGMIGQLDLVDRWWSIVQGVDPAECDDPEGLVRRLAGVGEDLDVDVLGSDPWTARMLLAPSYGGDRVFLVGDAAHLNPPWGGHGFNTCILDALNLTWKIAGVVDGWADESILDSYEEERRPAAARMIEVAASNGTQLAYAFVDPQLVDDGPAGEAARTQVHEKLGVKDAEFHSEGLVLGYRYPESSLVTSDGSEPPTADPVTYTPSASPGCLLPHLWLDDGRAVYDLLGREFTLLACGPVDEADVAELGTSGIPCAVVTLQEAEARRARELWQATYVLVRPDQHVAWRARDMNGVLDVLLRSASRRNDQSTISEGASR